MAGLGGCMAWNARFVGRWDGEWEVKRLNRGMDCGARSTATLIRVLNAGDTEGVGLCMGEITERNQRDTYRGVKGGRRGLHDFVRG